MPQLLRHDAVRLLEGCCEALSLAILSLGEPARVALRAECSRYSPALGLVGASADMAMKAVLIQGRGPRAVLEPDGKFKTVGTTLQDARQMLTKSGSETRFLTQGVEDPLEHLAKLHRATLPFTLISRVRAEALHGGMGAPRDVVVLTVSQVCAFLALLAESRRLGPYLRNRPAPIAMAVERSLLAEDLAHQLALAATHDKPAILRSLFLVLPESPADQPDWLDAFSRISVSPQVGDLEYLLDALAEAHPALIYRQAGSGEGFPVRVDQSDERALPIAPQFLRRAITKHPEMWATDLASANGRLEQNILHLPPAEAVVDLFVLGLARAGIPLSGSSLTGQQVWPFVAASLNVNGTIGPYWFLLNDLPAGERPQLLAHLHRAAKLPTGGKLRSRLGELEVGLEALTSAKGLPGANTLSIDMLVSASAALEARGTLMKKAERMQGTEKELTGDANELLESVLCRDRVIGDLLMQLALDPPSAASLAARRYWARTAAEASSDPEDTAGLVAVLRTSDLTMASTAVRKAIRRIDFLTYGPRCG